MELIWVSVALMLLHCSVSASGRTEDHPCFKSMTNAAAGSPSQKLWGEPLSSGPLPTSKFWQNFVLENGSQPEYIHPYSIKSQQGTLSLCYPKRIVQSNALMQVHSDDLSISAKEDSSNPFLVSSYDDLSVTLTSSSNKLAIPLVRGSPFITFLFQNSTPVFETIDAVVGFSSNSQGTKHRLQLNNGQTWLLYSSSPIPLSQNLSYESSSRFSGVIRVALLSENSTESVLDSFSSCFPLSGRVFFPSPFTMQHKYTIGGSCRSQVLMLALPMQRGIMQGVDGASLDGPRSIPTVSFMSIDGRMDGVAGDTWTMKIQPVNASWQSPRGLKDPAAAHEIGSALQRDVESLPRIIQDSSTYFFGKAAARAARLALIAQEVARYDLLERIISTLNSSLNQWLDENADSATVGNSIGFDSEWGGLISQNGAADAGADFGLGLYNDHHFHYGYFVYAGAVLAKLDPQWGNRHRCKLYALMGDYMQLDEGRYFPRLRHFDPWLMHSWAGGLKSFADGRNQESTSEAVNAYYAASLLGAAFGDESVRSLGLTLAAFEAHGAQSLWHVPRGSELYDARFVESNRVVGVLWANKRDTALWFAPSDWLEVRLGIQLLPLTTATEVLFPNLGFNKELVDWAASGPEAADSWKGFVYALQATYDPATAIGLARQLSGFDDGNSASNLLWWIHSRSENPEKIN